MQSLERVSVLESEKMSVELELDTLMKTLANANDDLRDMTTKCHELEDALTKERAAGASSNHLYVNLPQGNSSSAIEVKLSTRLQISPLQMHTFFLEL